jgi:hypothetical protein
VPFTFCYTSRVHLDAWGTSVSESLRDRFEAKVDDVNRVRCVEASVPDTERLLTSHAEGRCAHLVHRGRVGRSTPHGEAARLAPSRRAA